MRMSPSDLRDMNLFKYYRLVRKWACARYELSDADIELLIYLDCEGYFNRKGFKDGTYIYVWDKHRWERLRRDGWIDIWRTRNRTTQMYDIYKVSYQGKKMINRIYKILLGQEEINVLNLNPFYKDKRYKDKVFNRAIHLMRKDRKNEK